MRYEKANEHEAQSVKLSVNGYVSKIFYENLFWRVEEQGSSTYITRN